MEIYDLTMAAAELNQHRQTLKIKCQKYCQEVGQNDDIYLLGNKYIITRRGLRILRKLINPVGFPKGKRRAKKVKYRKININN
jgi:hypothetical protein